MERKKQRRGGWRTWLSQATDYLRDLALLAIAFLGSYSLVPLVSRPYTNPHNISNPLNPAGFNPDNNFYGIIFVIVGTVVGYFVLRWLLASRYSWAIKAIVACLLLLNFFLVNCLGSPGYATGPNGMDNFHAGEQLAPTAALMDGTTLYSEMFFLRGAGVDAVMPALGFLVFGKSIGSFLLISDLFMLLAIGSFFLLLAFLIKRPLIYALAILLFYVSDALSLVHVRDIPVWIAVGLLLLAFRRGLSTRWRHVLFAGVGFVSALTLYISIDRGVVLTAMAAGLAVLLAFVSFDRDGTAVWLPRHWKRNIRLSRDVAVGIFAGLALPALFLSSKTFDEFIRMTFFEIPRYGGLLVSQPFPGLYGDTALFWLPVALAAVTAILLVRLYRSGETLDLNRLLPYTVLFVFSVVCLKIGANRIALSKLASVTTPLYLAIVLIVVYAIVLMVRHPRLRQQMAVPVAAIILLVALFGQYNFAKLEQPLYTRSQLAAYRALPHSSDDEWLTPETSRVRNYILSQTRQDDPIFAFTSNPVYYYLTGRPNPSRFYVSWFADPQPYTDELLGDLKKDPPKLIIYEEKTWMDAPDTVPMQYRIPEVNAWIQENYKTRTQVGNTTVLSR